MIGASELAGRIDISAVKADSSRSEVERLYRVASKSGFGSVHVLPHWVPVVVQLQDGADGPRVGAPVGFPSGGTLPSIKVREATALVDLGVDEIDLVANSARLLSGDRDYVKDEIEEVIGTVGSALPVRVIFETSLLDDDLIRDAAMIAQDCGADMIKTGTGWSARPASNEHVAAVISAHTQGRLPIKVAGGIRDLPAIRRLIELGVARFGINHQDALKIVSERARQEEQA